MTSKKSFLFLSLLTTILFLYSCSEYKTTDNGLKYKIIVDSSGSPVEAGGVAFVDMLYTNEKDTFDSKKMNRNIPIPIRIPDSLIYKGSLEEGLALLSVGDSASFLVSTDSLYKNIFNAPKPAEIKEGSITTFFIKVVKVISKDSVAYIEKQRMQQQMEAELQRQIQFQNDTTTISDYCKKNKIKAKKTPDGVFYVIKKAAEGMALMPGDTAKTFYSGKLLDGTPFDSNVGKEPFTVVVGYDQVIRGWHSGLMAMKKGEKATIYIPSMLGYGERGAPGAIPPNAILVFDMEVLK